MKLTSSLGKIFSKVLQNIKAKIKQEDMRNLLIYMIFA